MRWVIDGYNVIRTDPELRGQEAAGGLNAGRSALLRRLAAVARERDQFFTVVFDGGRLHASDVPDAPAGGRIEILFSQAPESADDVLRRLAARWREACAVVSSDRAVETAARRAGAVAVRVEAFLSALSRATSDAGARDDEDEDDEEEEEEEDGTTRKRGNPRRASREERATRRALRRLMGY